MVFETSFSLVSNSLETVPPSHHTDLKFHQSEISYQEFC